jgi:2,4-dienoyl-CoA reductase-like NADH-dependent reductase (Old Yellow Enzyme family)
VRIGIMKKLEGKVALVTGAARGIGAPIAARLADLVAFGRPYIANPDLVERLATGAPLAEVDWETVYGSDHTAIPTIRLSVGRRPSELNQRG